jgi:hypothetical protein
VGEEEGASCGPFHDSDGKQITCEQGDGRRGESLCGVAEMVSQGELSAVEREDVGKGGKGG